MDGGIRPEQRERSSLVKNPVVHWEIVGADWQQLQKFYGDLFGWNVDVNEEFQYGMVTPEEGRGIPGGIGGEMGGGKRVSIYVEVDDPQAYLDKAEQMGGKTLMPPTQIMPDLTIAMFADPEGNVTGLTKANPAS
jgi:predicted enzyme related to lactoylglutathione lyase